MNSNLRLWKSCVAIGSLKWVFWCCWLLYHSIVCISNQHPSSAIIHLEYQQTREWRRTIPSERSDVLFHSSVFQIKYPLLLHIYHSFDSNETKAIYLNASRLRFEYLIKTSERLSLFWWQQTRLHSPGILANKGEEVRSIWSEGDNSRCNQTLLTIQNTDHSHTNT